VAESRHSIRSNSSRRKEWRGKEEAVSFQIEVDERKEMEEGYS